MPRGTAVRRFAGESDRQVLTVSGKFIAKFAETQRSQRKSLRSVPVGGTGGTMRKINMTIPGQSEGLDVNKPFFTTFASFLTLR